MSTWPSYDEVLTGVIKRQPRFPRSQISSIAHARWVKEFKETQKETIINASNDPDQARHLWVTFFERRPTYAALYAFRASLIAKRLLGRGALAGLVLDSRRAWRKMKQEQEGATKEQQNGA